MSSHVHPPGTPAPDDRAAFLIDGCERCAEYLDDLGIHFDADRFRAFWRKMVEVEYDDVGGYESNLDKQLGRRLYIVSLTLQRAFGIDARELAPPLAESERIVLSPEERARFAAFLRYDAEIEAGLVTFLAGLPGATNGSRIRTDSKIRRDVKRALAQELERGC